MEERTAIAVWGHYHGGNLGDELVVDTIVDAIRKRLPSAQIVGISMNPGDTIERHGISAFPINPDATKRRSSSSAALDADGRRRLHPLAAALPGARYAKRAAGLARRLAIEWPFIVRAYRMLRRVNLVVVAGSGQLLDEWRGPWLHPYTTFRWAMLARLARVPTVYPSVGAGPIDSSLSAFFIRRAVRTADYVSVRDDHSGRVLNSIGLHGAFDVCPDMGYGLREDLLSDVVRSPHGEVGRRTVGLNVMAHQDPRYWPRGDARRFDAFLQKMEEFTGWLLHEGWSVCLFSSQPRSDGRVARELRDRLEARGGLELSGLGSVVDEIQHVSELVGIVRRFDVVVAARYHSVLLPLLLGIPVVGLAYNPKTTELLKDIGHPERSIDIDSFTVEDLMSIFTDVASPEASGEREALAGKVAAHRRAVERQFDLLFGGVPTVPTAGRTG